ncbi:MAG: hypothetical protein JNN27_00755 [Planctomycetes bacterium]|nr:hypothetical protein [Planctomycetota bacterium]
MNDIHYWNRANFEGLLSLAAALRANPRLEDLAAHCELREKGLRREAFVRLEAFLEHTQRLEVPVQRELALQVLEAHWKRPEAHYFFTVPLREKFLEQVLEEWRAADIDDPVPLRSLALLRWDRDLLEQALRADPNDAGVRVALARLFIGAVDHATHHLVESRFLGDEDEAVAALDRAAFLLDGLADSSFLNSLRQDVKELNRLLCDWKQYRQAPEGAFPEWCRARGRDHDWWSIVYY